MNGKSKILVIIGGIVCLLSVYLIITVDISLLLFLLLGIVLIIVGSHSIQRNQKKLWKESVRLKRSSVKKESAECPNCGQWNLLSSKYCFSCGATLIIYCANCKKENLISDKHCTNCGAWLRTS